MNKLLLSTFVLFVALHICAQRESRLPTAEQRIEWKGVHSQKISDHETIELLDFANAMYDDQGLPTLRIDISNKNLSSFDIELYNVTEVELSADEKKCVEGKSINSEYEILTHTGFQRGQAHSFVLIKPLRVTAQGEYKKLLSYSYRITNEQAIVNNRKSNRSFVTESVLRDGSGDWYKVGVVSRGLYKVTGAYLASLAGQSNLPSNSIHLFGNSEGMLPVNNNEYRPDDLLENAIYMDDGGDGVFNEDDYFLFYGEGPDDIIVNGDNLFEHINNVYSDTSYYFINLDPLRSPKRVSTQNQSVASPTVTVTQYNDYKYIDKDDINMIKSGSEWYGDEFDVLTERTYSFNFPNIASDTMTIDIEVLGSHVSSSNSFTISSASPNFINQNIGVAATGNGQYDPPAKRGNGTIELVPGASNLNLNFQYNKPDASAKGWLNYIKVNARRQLVYAGNPLFIADLESYGTGQVADYTIQNSNTIDFVWEITDPSNITSINYTDNGSSVSFVMDADSLRSFVAFGGNSFSQPIAFHKIENQNLHAMGPADYLIVTAPEFLSQAERLADFHTGRGLSVQIATTRQIYNEFSSGMVDATAIRDFVRMFYERAAGVPSKMPKYLLLFGDGSYDNKYRLAGNHNFVPTYQSPEALFSTVSYVTDDYFALLDTNEGINNLDLVDIGVGRFIATNQVDATAMVDKTIHYMTRTGSLESNCSTCDNQSEGTLGDWRNTVAFVSDDEDGGAYVTGTENYIISQLNTNHPVFNYEKIYIDAYPQASTPGGERYYEAADQIKNQVQEGCLIMNYMGHGGEAGWAHERILDIPTINNWTNYDRLPLFMTATCEFTRFDDPGRVSAGELVFLNKNGGGCALFTTTRLVFSSGNTALNANFYQNVFNEVSGEPQALGDIYVATKNATTTSSSNHRKFNVIGDPALILAAPKHHVITDSINNQSISVTDTIGALSRVTISGHIADNPSMAIKTDFNGHVFPTVYDKSSELTTLGNNASSPLINFQSRRNVIYKGRASVVNGYFSFSFVVPKDIAYQIGPGRVSYYAHDGSIDAHGSNESFMIGGTGDSAITDNNGPEIELFMNSEQFVSGGTTDENPTILAKLFDDNGINTVGNGIGHDIMAIVDENTSNAIILNDYYEADLDTYQSGKVMYKLSNLEQGPHTLSFKAWDVSNNSSERTIDFVVSESADIALDHVLNYPNPFTTNTTFYFEHNQNCQSLDVQIQIYTISGKLVKTFDQIVQTDGFRIEGVNWDGRDEFGDQLARGVYIYNVNVRADDGKVAKKTEKLVILK